MHKPCTSQATEKQGLCKVCTVCRLTRAYGMRASTVDARFLARDRKTIHTLHTLNRVRRIMGLVCERFVHGVNGMSCG